MNPDGERLPDMGPQYPLSQQEDGVSSTPRPVPPPPPPVVPAGWYPDPDNTSGFRYGGVPSMRYFDGVQWTENRAPMQRRQPQHPMPGQPIIVNQQFAPQAAPSAVVVYNNGTSHGLHLVLTILTCGLWLPVWVIVAIINASR